MKLLAFILLISSFALAQSGTAKLRKGDTISLKLKGVPSSEQAEVSGEYKIDFTGYLKVTHLSDSVYAVGLDSSQLARKIEALYKQNEIYTSPNITIFASGDSGQKDRTVQVMGMVRKPGPIIWKENMTLFEVISFAGGLNDFGSYKDVRVTRDGKRRTFDARKDSDRNYKILPEDIIEVDSSSILPF